VVAVLLLLRPWRCWGPGSAAGPFSFRPSGRIRLSLVTPELGAFGKVLIALMMFLGRVGPLTLLLALRARAGLRISLPGGCCVGMSRQFAVIGMGRLRV